MLRSLVGSEMCIRDRSTGGGVKAMHCLGLATAALVLLFPSAATEWVRTTPGGIELLAPAHMGARLPVVSMAYCVRGEEHMAWITTLASMGLMVAALDTCQMEGEALAGIHKHILSSLPPEAAASADLDTVVRVGFGHREAAAALEEQVPNTAAVAAVHLDHVPTCHRARGVPSIAVLSPMAEVLLPDKVFTAMGSPKAVLEWEAGSEGRLSDVAHLLICHTLGTTCEQAQQICRNSRANGTEQTFCGMDTHDRWLDFKPNSGLLEHLQASPQQLAPPLVP
eukprot:TRINITY_DN8081_c0_g1_i1.p1 TRINITY_DN8081_c0_g1~~TRINITY_DN8081_c0_g1_i1.p1  ORF type:complete len:316 (+),score=66.51 TRINITY_DN8081_c0_g1_i1:107-949(+)